jgi:hypothetical protein
MYLRDVGDHFGCDTNDSSRNLKMHCAKMNIQLHLNQTPMTLLSWPCTRNQNGLTTLKLAVSIDRRMSLPSCPFCSVRHPSYSHYLICTSLPDSISMPLAYLRIFCNRYLNGIDIILILKVPSLVAELSRYPKLLLEQLATLFSNLFVAIQAGTQVQWTSAATISPSTAMDN